MIDLHTHTTASDGTLTPTELVRLAARDGLEAIAITDHDTLDGVHEAREAGAVSGVEVVSGVELATLGPWGGGVHLLGFHIDPDDPGLVRALAWLRAGRERRAEKMVARFRELGLDLTEDEVRDEARGEVIARPHFARVLIRKGFVASWSEAFDRFLTNGGKAYVPRERLSFEEATRVVRGAGGVPVLAHPGFIRMRRTAFRSWARRMARLGLGGVECGYPTHDDEEERHYQTVCAANGLVCTAGSDFHGPEGDKRLGHATGGRPISDQLLEPLAEAARRVREGG